MNSLLHHLIVITYVLGFKVEAASCRLAESLPITRQTARCRFYFSQQFQSYPTIAGVISIGSKVVKCQEKKVAQARLAPHEYSNALAHTTRMRAGDGAALPCYRSKSYPTIAWIDFITCIRFMNWACSRICNCPSDIGRVMDPKQAKNLVKEQTHLINQ